MGMNNRILRPRASGYVAPDADARAYLASVRTADGSNLEPAVAKAINDFVAGCKTDSIWDAIKACCILCGAKTLSGALTPLKGTAPTNNGPFVAGDYDRETGLLGNGSTKWLDSGRNNNADPQDSKHIAIYRSVAATNDAGMIGSNNTTSGHSHIYAGFGSFIFRNNAATSLNEPLSTNTGAVFVGTSRASSASFGIQVGSASNTTSVTSQTPANANIRVFETGGRTNARLAFYSIGESLDLALLQTRVDAIIAAIQAAI
jgi:hypothetical protein